MQAWKLGLCSGDRMYRRQLKSGSLSRRHCQPLRVGELDYGIPSFPEGVVNIIPGYGETAGAAISSHMDVDKVAFTGSTEVGKLIALHQPPLRSNLKRVTLELGGKSPNIVFADSDMDAAVEGAFFALFFNQGQCCCAGSRLMVEDTIHDEFVRQRLPVSPAPKSRRLAIRSGSCNTTQGPQVSEEQFNKIIGYIESGKSSGANMRTGGGRVGKLGYFIEPTVFTDVKDDMKISPRRNLRPRAVGHPFQRRRRRYRTRQQIGCTVSPPPSGPSDISGKAHRIAAES